MARFRFALQPVLDLRQREEDQRQKAVGELEQERLRIEDGLRRRQHSIARAREEVREGLVGSLDPNGLRSQANASLSLMRDAQRTVLELAGIHRRLEGARRDLQEASRRRRAMELLRDRRESEWRRNLDRREQAAIDELSMTRPRVSVLEDP